MLLIRYRSRTDTASEVRIGVRGEDGTVRRVPVAALSDLLALSLPEFRAVLEGAAESGEPEPAPVQLLAPVDGLTEVWASGVTYRRSSEARQEESVVADVYARVYDAERPELFFKSVAWRSVGDGAAIGIRGDSDIDVPEPELALVINSGGEVVGYTVCDDVSSRSIEGENPLYLPQAKVYADSCALGPGIRPVWKISDPYQLEITVEVRRDGIEVWSGRTSTSLLHRRLDELVEHLYRQLAFPAGAILSTGTGLVPELDFTLADGDEVRIAISGIGTLANPVVALDRLRPSVVRA